jgi:hypothetical protein
MNFTDTLKSLFPMINKFAAEEAAKAMEDLAEKAKNPTERAVLGLLSDALEKHGPAGLTIAETAVIDLLEGKQAMLDFADLKTGSDALAVLQNVEADKKSAVKDFTAAASQQIGVVVGTILKGAILGG